MSEQRQQTIELLPTPPQPGEVVFFDKVEEWGDMEMDDDSIVAAHEGAADFLDEQVRSEADQAARDELAAKLLNLITSASESRFSDAGRKFDLINQLVTRFGHLCDQEQLQQVLDKHTPEGTQRRGSKTETDSLDSDDDERPNRAAQRRSFSSFFKRAGSIALKPLFAGLRSLGLVR